jgi:hypothetical protein
MRFILSGDIGGLIGLEGGQLYAVRMGKNFKRVIACEGHERDVGRLCSCDSKGRGGRYGKDHRGPCHGRFLHHFDGDTGCQDHCTK